MIGELEGMASNTKYSNGETLVSVRFLPVYEDDQAKVEAGLLNLLLK